MSTDTEERPVRWMGLRPWQRHSIVLAVAGFVYIAIGAVYINVPLTGARAESLKLALFVPLPLWGIVWVCVGTLALISTRWPPASKTWGYTALSGLAAGWGSIYLLGALLLDSPSTNLSGALVWYLVAFLWWAISGLMNPDDMPDGA